MASLTQNIVKCHCSACDQYLFSCVNSWTQITKSYYLYSNQSQKAPSSVGLLVLPTTVPGTSEMEGCTLRPLRCKGCTALKGGECVEAPAEKARYRCVLSQSNEIRHTSISYKDLYSEDLLPIKALYALTLSVLSSRFSPFPSCINQDVPRGSLLIIESFYDRSHCSQGQDLLDKGKPPR